MLPVELCHVEARVWRRELACSAAFAGAGDLDDLPEIVELHCQGHFEVGLERLELAPHARVNLIGPNGQRPFAPAELPDLVPGEGLIARARPRAPVLVAGARLPEAGFFVLFSAAFVD